VAGLLASLGCAPAEVEPAATNRPVAVGEPVATARYLANAGVLISSGDTKLAFDPLFRNDFGSYRLLPPDLERALFAGEPPFDGLDAVLISHYHGDHFSPADVLRLLELQPGLRLYAPEQAVSALRSAAGGAPPEVFARVTGFALDYGDPPRKVQAGALLVEAVRIPHSGWPEGNVDVENLSYRVTLDGAATVLHLGDADTRDAHFEQDAAYWKDRHTHIAFPPYWFFLSEEGRHVLEHRLEPGQAVGVHVPTDIPESPGEREPELRNVDLFMTPGETREVRERP
jgi:L-ascorbate metabolism protein UlaG (beta-lactamase superfamily)